MTEELPEVSIWNHAGSNVWEFAGSIAAYRSLRFEPRFLEDGDWEMELDYDDLAQPLTVAGCLVTIDYRSVRTTWTVVAAPSHPAGDVSVLRVSGSGALSLLGQETAWRDPHQPIGSQPEATSDYTLYVGKAEFVIRSLVQDNYIDRAGRPLALQPNQGAGADSRARTSFANLQELVVRKARAGGVGVNVILVSTSDTTAELRLRIWEPVDRSTNVYLSTDLGTLEDWASTVEPPTLTQAIVSGAANIFKIVTTPASIADANAFGGHRAALVPGGASFDDDDLQQAGEEALKDGASKVNVTLTASDTEGLQAFRDYQVGDLVTGKFEEGLQVVDNISSLSVTVEEGFPVVTPTFGDPASDDPTIGLGQLIRSQDRRLRAQEEKG